MLLTHWARRLHGGQEQRDQDGDDRDHHQQLDQGEPSVPRGTVGSTWLKPDGRLDGMNALSSTHG
jgi:hypothetical protein